MLVIRKIAAKDRPVVAYNLVESAGAPMDEDEVMRSNYVTPRQRYERWEDSCMALNTDRVVNALNQVTVIRTFIVINHAYTDRYIVKGKHQLK